MGKTMQGHYWIINSQLIGLFLLSLFPIQGITNQSSLFTIMDEQAFNQLWDEECRDIGERPLEPYLVSPDSLTPTFVWEGKVEALSTNFFLVDRQSLLVIIFIVWEQNVIGVIT